MVTKAATAVASALLLLAVVNSAHALRSLHSGGPPPSGSGGAYPLTRSGSTYNCPSTATWTTCSIDQLRTIYNNLANSLNDPTWDDGNRAGAYIRGAWHNCGTYDYFATGATPVGGCAGAHMRFSPEQDDGANSGLQLPGKGETITIHSLVNQYKVPCITYADLWTMAGVVAFATRSGGKMVPKWRPGRCDAPDGSDAPPNGRLPDASFKTLNGTGEAAHLRTVFGRMGYNDRQIVILSAIGHRMGRCHKSRSNFDGAWDNNAVNFDTAYLKNLLGNQWGLTTQIKNTLSGQMVYSLNQQYVNNNGEGSLLMLPTDMCLRQDPTFLQYVNYYINNQDQFNYDGAVTFATLMENGVKFQDKYATMWVN